MHNGNSWNTFLPRMKYRTVFRMYFINILQSHEYNLAEYPLGLLGLHWLCFLVTLSASVLPQCFTSLLETTGYFLGSAKLELLYGT